MDLNPPLRKTFLQFCPFWHFDPVGFVLLNFVFRLLIRLKEDSWFDPFCITFDAFDAKICESKNSCFNDTFVFLCWFVNWVDLNLICYLRFLSNVYCLKRHFLDHKKVKKDFQYIKNDSRIEKRLHNLLKQNSSICPKKFGKFFPQQDKYWKYWLLKGE